MFLIRIYKKILTLPKKDIMTDAQKDALRENLYNKSVRELVEMLIVMQEEVDEAKQIRRRFMQIQNLLKDPDERRKQGRPKKDI